VEVDKMYESENGVVWPQYW